VKRRDFLSITLALTGAGLLAGCGGSGSSTSTNPNALQGRVRLPAGMSMAGLTVQSLLGQQQPVQGDGSFSVVVEAGGPSLAIAAGAGGEPLLFGFARTERSELSVRTTAEVLAFVACGGVCLPGVMQPVLITELESADLSRVEAVLTSLLTTHGEGWLEASDSGLKAALIEDTKPFRPSSTRGAAVTPTGKVSGITVESDGIGTTVVTNYFRRRTYIYAERVSYTDAKGDEHPSALDLTPEPISLSPIRGASSTLTTIAQYMGGQRDFLAPVASPALRLPLTPSDASTTLYRLTAVGLGFFPGDFDKLTAQQQDAWLDASLRTLIIDFLVPIFTGLVLPIKSEQINAWLDHVRGSAFLKDAVTFYAAVPDIITRIKARDYMNAQYDMLQLFVKSSGLKNDLFLAFELFLKAAFSTGYEKQFMLDSLGKLNKLLTEIDFFLQLVDTAFIIMDVGRSQAASQWEVTVTPPKLELTPKTTIVSVGAAADFTVKVVDSGIDSGLVTYKWSVGKGTFTNTTSGATGMPLETSKGSVQYRAPATVTDNEKTTLTVEAFLGGVNDPNRRSLGTATAELTLRSVVIYGEAEVAFSGVTIPSDPKNRVPIEFVGGNWARTSPVSLTTWFGKSICPPSFDGPGGVGAFGLRTGIAFDFAAPPEAGKTYPLELGTAHNYLALKWTTSGNVESFPFYEGSVKVTAVEGKRVSFTLTARCQNSGTPETNPRYYGATVTASGWFQLA
jgi:hypothetical protein